LRVQRWRADRRRAVMRRRLVVRAGGVRLSWLEMQSLSPLKAACAPRCDGVGRSALCGGATFFDASM